MAESAPATAMQYRTVTQTGAEYTLILPSSADHLLVVGERLERPIIRRQSFFKTFRMADTRDDPVTCPGLR